MQDPLPQLPAGLQTVITTFKQLGLNLACERFYALGWSPLQAQIREAKNEQEAKEIWLWSRYFDAHLFSSSLNEWGLCSSQLIEHIELMSSWIIYHEELLIALQEIHARAMNAQIYLERANGPLDDTRLKTLIDCLRSLIGKPNDLRIPLHRLSYASKNTHGATSLIDLSLLMEGHYPQAKGEFTSYWLCTSVQALCLALDLVGMDHFKDLSFICAGIEPPPSSTRLQPLPVEKPSYVLPTDQRSLEEWLMIIHGPSSDCHLREIAYQSILKSLENEARTHLFQRYESSSLELLYRFQFEDWYQRLSRRSLQLPNDPLPLQLKKLQSLAIKRPRLPLNKKLPRVVHVISQLVDEMHAPSKLLYRLLSLGDTTRFDYAVIVTEAICPRPTSYPMTLRQSESSQQRGAHFIKFLDRHRIAYYIDEPSISPDLQTAANAMVDRLAKLDIDLIVFHGPEPLHHYIASCLDGPIKVVFEHGTLPMAPGFEHAICCLEDTLSINSEDLEGIGTRPHILPFFSDARWSWDPHFPLKSELGIDEEAIVATTISNHLYTRLTAPFCQTISQILKRCPQMLYLPIGAVGSPDKEREILERFDPQVHKQIRFLGAHPKPSQLVRCMDLYFNEFPFGSCLGILDAMATGCGVVTMYDPKGPPQARYGGLFIGLDRAITSLEPEDYVAYAVKLYEDPLSLFLASQRSFQYFEWRSNLWAYVDKFESLLDELMASS